MTNKSMTEKYNTEIKLNQPAKRVKSSGTLGSFDDQSILEKSLYEIKNRVLHISGTLIQQQEDILTFNDPTTKYQSVWKQQQADYVNRGMLVIVLLSPSLSATAGGTAILRETHTLTHARTPETDSTVRISHRVSSLNVFSELYSSLAANIH